MSKSNEKIQGLPKCFIRFNRNIDSTEIPNEFNFPFYHKPHPLCEEAVKELQTYLQTQTEWEHNFGLQPNQKGLVIGKMFGVMIVESKDGIIGYLTAFSGKLANKNAHSRFVPPIFDMLQPDGFFLKGETVLNKMNKQILDLEHSTELKHLFQDVEEIIKCSKNEIQKIKDKIKKNKERRALQRADATFSLCAEGQEAVLEDLRLESIREQGELRFVQREMKAKTAVVQSKLETFLGNIEQLKHERSCKSVEVQEQLFAQYNFLNIHGKQINVKDVFLNIGLEKPPSGAGECALPKMLQYAFLHQLKPICFAEFWWGASPVSEIRKHNHFYPACRGKCEPILAHMLEGVVMEENPMLQPPEMVQQLKVVYEDETIIVIDKPSEMLSVPGKIKQTSVLGILKNKFPNATGPLLVHRLDMATSGLLIAAKTKEAYQNIQAQFIKRKVSKIYIALLDGNPKENEGEINLPLRVDLDNRPHQLVCFEHGKPARTIWQKISIEGAYTRVQLVPVTGRTHQLRVHCAHQLGLNIPIVGDDLYGEKAVRLMLHAYSLSIKHPISRKELTFISEAPF
ncbi:MAG TPA: RluA family pseudouridine synthase [Edaphocola sp.]|nr:RluA family pseudouridine synthase [Edaphocola sp.]